MKKQMRVKKNSRDLGRNATQEQVEIKMGNEKEVKIRVENRDITTIGKTAQTINMETITREMRAMSSKKYIEIQVENEK